MNITPKELNRILKLDLSNFNAGNAITFCSECDWQTGKRINEGCDCNAHLHVMEVTEDLIVNFKLRLGFVIYEQAIKDILYTHAYLKREAEADQCILNGNQAVVLSNNATFLKGIAQTALMKVADMWVFG